MYATDVAVEAAVAGAPFREAYKAAAAGADSAGQGVPGRQPRRARVPGFGADLRLDELRALAGAVLMAGTVYLVMAMRRPDFNDAAVQPHRDFLDALQAQGKLQLTGGFADGSGGAYVLCNVDSLAQAQAIVATDPLVTMHASDLTVHEWNTR